MSMEPEEKSIPTQPQADEADELTAGEQSLTAEETVDISGDTTITLNFDSSGDASDGITKYCAGITIDIDAYIDGCAADSKFDIKLDTDYSQHFAWSGIALNQHIKQSIKTNKLSKTKITVSVHSNKPNTSATAHIHYST